MNRRKALVPQLRFPDFRDAGDWEQVALGEIAEIKLGKMLDGQKHTTGRLQPYLNNVSVRWNEVNTSNLPQMYFDDDELDRFGLRAGDVVVCEGGEPGRAAIWDGRLPDIKFQKAIHRVRFNVPFEPRMLVLYLEAIAGTTQFEMLFTGGGIKHLTRDTFARLKIPVGSPAEQRRIADCLSSVDELIAAQARKVDALKTHKKGLMRQLFPREGETQPRLRLPEFREAPDWESSSLGRVFETTSGGTPSRSEASYWDGGIPWITTSLVDFGVITEAEEFISEDGLNNSSAKLLPKGTVLIAMYGQGKTRGQVALLGVEATTNQACAAVLPKDGIDPYFVFLNLAGQYEEFRKLSNSGGQENLSQGLIREFPFAYPLNEEEQKRIADCLTSLDDLITATTQELDALKAHKKGLMQQIFPSAGEAA